MQRDLVRIDGSRGEGGGQILRTALSMAALLRQPMQIDHIRANRPKPGLRPQHLTAVRAMSAISGASMQGDRLNSTSLSFTPSVVQGGSHRFEIDTAGSAILVLATLLPALLYAESPSLVSVTGGTHVPFSPTYHYFEEVFLPVLRRMGAKVRTDLKTWGWYPVGGGQVEMEVNPGTGLNCVALTARGKLKNIEAIIGLSRLPDHVGEREEAWLAEKSRRVDCRFQSRIDRTEAACPGNMVFLKGEFEHGCAGFSSLGRKGKPSEQVAGEAWSELMTFLDSNAAVDRFLADQMLLYMALAKGESAITVEQLTTHLRTNIEVIEQFLPVQFQVDKKSMTVRVKGMGRLGN